MGTPRLGPKDLSEFRFTVFVIFAVLAVGLKKKKLTTTNNVWRDSQLLAQLRPW